MMRPNVKETKRITLDVIEGLNLGIGELLVIPAANDITTKHCKEALQQAENYIRAAFMRLQKINEPPI